MISLERTDKDDPRFISLVKLLDMDLSSRYEGGNVQYQPLNTLQNITAVVLALEDDLPIGCGSFKPYDYNSVEIKRVFVKLEFRGRGISKLLIEELENCAFESGFTRAVLETGNKQHEAIALYERIGYQHIPNYGPYAGMENSICFEKDLSAQKRGS